MNNVQLEDLGTAASELPSLLTCREAANFARTCTRTIRRWISAGRLAATKTSPGKHGKILIPRAALLRLLAGGN